MKCQVLKRRQNTLKSLLYNELSVLSKVSRFKENNLVKEDFGTTQGRGRKGTGV